MQDALHRLERALATARRENHCAIKIVHGYGSTGVGGDIRIALQKRLRQLVDSGEIRGCIFGEDWATSSDDAWRLLQMRPELKNDPDLGRANPGITVVNL